MSAKVVASGKIGASLEAAKGYIAKKEQEAAERAAAYRAWRVSDKLEPTSAARKQAEAQARGAWIEQQEAADAAAIQEILAAQQTAATPPLPPPPTCRPA